MSQFSTKPSQKFEMIIHRNFGQYLFISWLKEGKAGFLMIIVLVRDSLNRTAASMSIFKTAYK